MRISIVARGPRAACCLLFLSFAMGSAHAVVEPPSIPDLTAAVRSAWSLHPASEATEQTLAAAKARAEASASPLYNPELEVAVDRDGDERSTTAGLAWTLDIHGKRRVRAELGAAELTVAEAEAALRRSAFALRWLQAWADHSAATERIRLSDQRVALVQRFADLAERQFKVGDISSLERDLAWLARDEAQADQASVFGDAAIAEEDFRAVGGDPALTLPLSNQPAAPNWQGTSSELGIRSPEGRLSAAMSASAEQRIAVATGERRPDPTLSLRGGRIDLGPRSDNVVGVAISVPLFVRNTFRAEVDAARAEANASAAEQRRVELELGARAERATRTYAAVSSAWTRWSQSPGTEVEARADLLERVWRAGEISTSDYLVQLDQSLATALAGADLRGRLWRSYVDALYATGQLDAWIGFEPTDSEVTP